MLKLGDLVATSAIILGDCSINFTLSFTKFGTTYTSKLSYLGDVVVYLYRDLISFPIYLFLNY